MQCWRALPHCRCKDSFPSRVHNKAPQLRQQLPQHSPAALLDAHAAADVQRVQARSAASSQGSDARVCDAAQAMQGQQLKPGAALRQGRDAPVCELHAPGQVGLAQAVAGCAQRRNRPICGSCKAISTSSVVSHRWQACSRKSSATHLCTRLVKRHTDAHGQCRVQRLRGRGPRKKDQHL